MCLSHCDVKIWTAWLGWAGVRGQSGHHTRTRQPKFTGHRLSRETDDAGSSTGGAEEGGTVYQTWQHRTEGVQSSSTDNRIAEADHKQTRTTVSAPPVRSYQDGNQNPSPDDRAGRSQEQTCNPRGRWGATSAEGIIVRTGWLRESGRGPSEPSETSQWRLPQRPAFVPRVALHIALHSQFHRVFSLCLSAMLNIHSGSVANCDHTSWWVDWVHPCTGIRMWWVMLQKPLLAFLLPARTMKSSLY